jgi:hypothetical protein
MFRQLIACHPQGTFMVLAKITIKHEHSSIVMGVAAYHGLVCAVYSVHVSVQGGMWTGYRLSASPHTSLHRNMH